MNKNNKAIQQIAISQYTRYLVGKGFSPERAQAIAEKYIK
jgi:hypothetical protein